MPEIDWDDLRYVLALARVRAIAPAARVMRVNATTVARRIFRVEAALGSKLFERKDGCLRPTEAAAHVIERAEHIEAEAKAIVEQPQVPMSPHREEFALPPSRSLRAASSCRASECSTMTILDFW